MTQSLLSKGLLLLLLIVCITPEPCVSHRNKDATVRTFHRNPPKFNPHNRDKVRYSDSYEDGDSTRGRESDSTSAQYLRPAPHPGSSGVKGKPVLGHGDAPRKDYLAIPPPYNQTCSQCPTLVTSDDGKAYFLPTMWMISEFNGLDYCSLDSLYAASVDNARLNSELTKFMEANNIGGFGLAATDYEEEGTFKWVRTNEPVNYTNWATGEPSGDRGQNCLAMAQDGKWFATNCRTKANYIIPLCEVPMLYPTREQLLDTAKFTVPKRQSNSASPPTDMARIGSVGNKQYFAVHTRGSGFFASLDFCHERHLRVPTPSNEEERTFLYNHTKETQSDMFTSYTDMVTPTCTKLVSRFRSIYDNRPIYSGPPDPGHHGGFGCLVLDMFSGQGFRTILLHMTANLIVCELETKS